MRVSRLSGPFGVEVAGFCIDKNSASSDISELKSLLYEHAVICIRDQNIESHELAAFGSLFGEAIKHNEENLRLDGLETVMSLSNADNRDERQLNGGAHWHTDLVHSEEPASFTMLHAVAVPVTGGGTLFANQIMAFDNLDHEFLEEIRDLRIIHCYEGRTDGSYPEIIHKLIRSHPVSGKQAIYGAADTGIGIVDMNRDEALALYIKIGKYATQKQFVYRHQYQLNDIVIWDNAQLLHSAEVLERAVSEEDRRIMHRVSVRGWDKPLLS
ncbi:MAG: hypothetical protein GKR93_00870 [Gammaproteobacteria bacterium]|nr:hypothetical protein [Gammaproteobacteria bacterium]